MTNRALTAMWLGVTLTVLMGLYPPWVQCVTRSSSGITVSGYTVVSSRGYGFLFAPPFDSDTAFVDLSRLTVQWALVGAVTLATVLTVNRPPSPGVSESLSRSKPSG